MPPAVGGAEPGAAVAPPRRRRLRRRWRRGSTPSDFKGAAAAVATAGPGPVPGRSELAAHGEQPRLGSGHAGLTRRPCRRTGRGRRGPAHEHHGALDVAEALYALGTSSVTPLGHEDGGDPQARRGGARRASS